MVKENLKEVEEKITAACERAGRDRNEVTLIAVSKTKPMEMIEEAYSAGKRDFGENKAQEMKEKHDALPDDIKCHFIGHLQTNKVKYVVGRATLIHSVDSLHLAEAIEKESDIHSDSVVVNRVLERKLVGDTDIGQELKEQIEDLKMLLQAYRSGEITERM